MRDRPANLPASISARLRNIARAKQANPELILRRYAMERLLSRLSLSPYHDRFILKGAMLFTVWLMEVRLSIAPVQGIPEFLMAMKHWVTISHPPSIQIFSEPI